MTSTAISTAFRDVYDLSFQVSPIILKGGTVTIPGGMMPIIGLVGQLAAFAQGVASGGLGFNDFFARYIPIPGGTVIKNEIGKYPFANQQVAANAVIQQPTNISLLMIAPVRDTGGYLTKLAIFESLITALTQHNNAGGTYIIATPAHIYTDCVMTGMTDVTTGETKQQMIQWQLDFEKPLISLADAEIALSGLAGKAASGQKLTSPAWTGGDGASSSMVPGVYGQVGSSAAIA